MNRKYVVSAFQQSGVKPNDRLLIACSGGLDSVALVHLVKEMRYAFALAHVNHHTRGEASLEDEQFVHRLAEALGVAFYRADYHHNGAGNFQQQARDFRYQWMESLCLNEGYHWICTAHHLDDQRETLLQKMLRGAGAQSLAGIRTVRGNRLRPLLRVSKNELRKYARSNGIVWREDASNETIHYERNYVRQILLPHAASMHPRGLKGLDVTMRHLADQSQRLEHLLQWWRGKMMRQLPGMLEIDLDVLPPGEQRAKWLGDVLLSWGNFDVQMILDKADRGESAQSIAGEHALVTSLARLFLTQSALPKPVQYNWSTNEIRLNGSQRLVINDDEPTKHALDATMLPTSMLSKLRVRSPENGDRLRISDSMNKKVSDFLLEKRVPLPMRHRMVWLVCYEDEILWIPGLYRNPHYQNMGEESCNIAFYSPLF